MTRTRIGLAAAAGFAALGLTACGQAEVATPAAVVADSVQSVETQALTAMGLDAAPGTDPLAAPAASPSGAAPKKSGGHNGSRGPLSKNTLHGEMVVKTKDGPKTVDFQRGTVTAVDDKSVTVKSTDGFTLTWAFGNPLKVTEHHTSVQPSAVKVGAKIGLIGTKEGDTTTARRIVIR